MKIGAIVLTDINTHNINKTRPVFKASSRTAYYPNGSEFNTTTVFFRSDIDWENFIHLLEKKFKNVDKVNIIDHACSTGEEAYSIAIALKSLLGDKAGKYLPIDARDYDKHNINKANGKVFVVDESEIETIRYFTKDEFDSYFTLANLTKQRKNGLDYLVAKSKIANSVKFTQSDIFKDIDTISGKNTVLLCKNMWPYLTLGEQKILAKKIASKLDSSSLLVLGYCDVSYGVEKIFEKLGFKHTDIYNVMEKMPPMERFLSKVKRILKFR